MVDDKLWLLHAMKAHWGRACHDGVAQQGHYVTDPRVKTLPAPDVTVERVGEMLSFDAGGAVAATRSGAPGDHMQFRTARETGPRVAAIGLGCMGMSDFYGPRDEAESIATIHRALDLGHELSRHGRHVRSVHERGARRPRDSRPAQRSRARDEIRERARPRTERFTASTDGPNTCGRRATRRSTAWAWTRSISTTSIASIRTMPIEETVGAMADLVRAGKVRYLGLSEAAPATIRRAHAVHPISALQTEYSLWSRDPEDEICSTLPRPGNRLRRVQSARTRLPYGPLQIAGRLCARRLATEQSTFSGGEFSAEPSSRRRHRGARVDVRGARRLSSRRRGSRRRETTSCRFPDRNSARGWKRTSPRPRSPSRQPTSERIDEVAPHGVAAGTRYTEGGMRAVNR